MPNFLVKNGFQIFENVTASVCLKYAVLVIRISHSPRRACSIDVVPHLGFDKNAILFLMETSIAWKRFMAIYIIYFTASCARCRYDKGEILQHASARTFFNISSKFAIFGLGDLLGLLLAVPVASCIKTLADAAREGDLRPRQSTPAPEAP